MIFNFLIPLKTFSSFHADQWVLDREKAKLVLSNLQRTLVSIKQSAEYFCGLLSVNIISGHENR